MKSIICVTLGHTTCLFHLRYLFVQMDCCPALNKTNSASRRKKSDVFTFDCCEQATHLKAYKWHWHLLLEVPVEWMERNMQASASPKCASSSREMRQSVLPDNQHFPLNGSCKYAVSLMVFRLKSCGCCFSPPTRAVKTLSKFPLKKSKNYSFQSNFC